MTTLCQQYLSSYQGMLSTLHREDEDEFDEAFTVRCSEIRKSLFELFAEAIRVLGDKDSKAFKLKCEELEEELQQ